MLFKYHPDDYIIVNNKPVASYDEFIRIFPGIPLVKKQHFEYDHEGVFALIVKNNHYVQKDKDRDQFVSLIQEIEGQMPAMKKFYKLDGEK